MLNEAALNLSTYFTKISLWAWQWNMKVNADKSEQVVFSCKREGNRYIIFLHLEMELQNLSENALEVARAPH